MKVDSPVVPKSVQARGEVLSVERSGAYHVMKIAVAEIPEVTRPGQFVAVAVGGETSSMLLRRAFAIYRVSPHSRYASTLQFVFAVHGKGTAWLARRRSGEHLDVVGPLGTPFRVPDRPIRTVLIGGSYGSAPLFTLADALLARNCLVDIVLCASTADKLFGIQDARRVSRRFIVATEDGSLGEDGTITSVLPELLANGPVGMVYASGPMNLLRTVDRITHQNGVRCQVAVEEAMACGTGICMTCVLPVIGDDGLTRMTRSCVEGPVFFADRLRWDDVGRLPADVVGAAAMGVGQ